MLRIEMLCTGDEVLHGQIVDTNGAWLADYLFDKGLPMCYRTTVGDNLQVLVNVMRERSQQCDVLIINGGLGPTSDDLSALAAAMALGEELVEHPQWVAKMEEYFARRGRVMAAINRKQALLPASAEVIDNPVGTACGFIITMNGCQIFFTPGVPSEFKMMVQQQIVPRLQQQFPSAEPLLCLRLTTFGRSESSLAAQLAEVPVPKGAQLGYRSSMPIIELKLTGPAWLRGAMESAWQMVRQKVKANCIFEGTAGLPAWLSERLRQRKLTVAISEQFSAGLLHWQLSRADAPLKCGEVQPYTENCDMEEAASRARILATRSQADIIMVIGELQEAHISVALHFSAQKGSGKSHIMTVRYRPHHHSMEIRQQVVVMLLQDMLRRWLNGESVYGEYEWLTIVERANFC